MRDGNITAAGRLSTKGNKLELELEFYFYLDMVNPSDKIIILIQSIITITFYFNLYKRDLKFKSEIKK